VESDAEIAEFQDPVGSNQTVARSDVAMDGACGVEQFDGPQQSDNLAAGSWFGPRVGMTLQVVVEIASFHQFRDQAVEGFGCFIGNPGEGFMYADDSSFIFQEIAKAGFAVPCSGLAGYLLLRIWWLVLRRR